MADKGYSEAAWQTVQIARHQERPQTLDYISESSARLSGAERRSIAW